MDRSQYLWRYTNLPALIYLLTEKKITLLDPSSWDDSNDSHYLMAYKKNNGLKTLLALCFTQIAESYHYWYVFANGHSGVCIKFKREEILRDLNKLRSLRKEPIDYLTLDELRSKKKIDPDHLPFIKRIAFEDEVEFRVIYGSYKLELRKDIPISLSCISRVTLSPWMNKGLAESVKKNLRQIAGCKNLKIYTSTLISNANGKESVQLLATSPDSANQRMKKYLSITIFLIVFLLSYVQIGSTNDLSLPKDTPVKVFFSPKGGCTEAIISEIDQAKTEILVQAYSV